MEMGGTVDIRVELTKQMENFMDKAVNKSVMQLINIYKD